MKLRTKYNKDMKTKNKEISELSGTFVIGNHELTFMQIREQTFVQFTNRTEEDFDDGMHRITDMKNFIDIASKIIKNKTSDEIIAVITKNNFSEQKKTILQKKQITNKKDKVVVTEFMLN